MTYCRTTRKHHEYKSMAQVTRLKYSFVSRYTTKPQRHVTSNQCRKESYWNLKVYQVTEGKIQSKNRKRG